MLFRKLLRKLRFAPVLLRVKLHLVNALQRGRHALRLDRGHVLKMRVQFLRHVALKVCHALSWREDLDLGPQRDIVEFESL